MSLGFMNYNPQMGVQYPVYPYDSGMAYPPYGLRWPLPQVRGNAMLPYAISEGLCARNGQWPWFLRTPRLVTGRRRRKRTAGVSAIDHTISAITTGAWASTAGLVAYLLLQARAKRQGRKMTSTEVWLSFLVAGLAAGIWSGLTSGPVWSGEAPQQQLMEPEA